MKKFILSLLMILGICGSANATCITSSYVTADDITVTQMEQNRIILTNCANSLDGNLVQTGSITTAKLDANANPENRWNEGFNDFVFTGLTTPTSASLSSTTASGTLYMNGVRVLKDATAKTYTASKHTFVDLSDNGTYTYSEVEINATEPPVATNSLRLARVSTDTSTVLEVRDDRVTTITLAAGSTGSIADTLGTTQIQTEETSEEGKLRFDVVGTEVGLLSATGSETFFTFNSHRDEDGDTKIQVEVSADDDIVRIDTAGTERWVMSALGERTMPTQPAFAARNSASQTDIAVGSAVEVVFGVEIYDVSNDFASNTFTAPVTGKYPLYASVMLQEIDSAASDYKITILTSNRSWVANLDPRQFAGDIVGDYSLVISHLIDMDINDTATVTIEQTGGAQQTDIVGTERTLFSGFLGL